MKNVLLLTGGTLAFWAVLFWPARLVLVEHTLLFTTTACLLCLVPAALTVLWTERAFGRQPELVLLAVLGGTGARMLFVVVVGMVLFHFVPAFNYQRFWLCVIVFYLATLAIEVSLLARRPSGVTRGNQGH